MAIPIVLGALVCFVVIGSITVIQSLYNVYFSPLKDIPGPLLAKLTTHWLTLVDLTGQRTTVLHQLHQKYGDTVRIGPNEVSFSNKECIQEIYSQQTSFIKAEIYETMSLPPLGIFSMRNRAEHSQRRRLLSHAFAQNSLFESEPLIREHVTSLLRCAQEGLDVPLDVMRLFRLVAFDIVGDLFLGQSFGGLESAELPQFLLDMDQHFLLSGLETSFPLAYALFSSLPVPRLKYIFQARERLIAYGKSAFETYVARHGRKQGRKDLLTRVVSVKAETGLPPLTDKETYTEISNLVFAGTDTTSMTLTYMFWRLAKNVDWQQRLRDELRSNISTKDKDLPLYTDLIQLPILDAVINEALRLHPAAPASLPRETPSGGRTLNGYYIPEKTVVSMQCYTTQRDPEVFVHPNEFDPQRWIDGQSDDMKELFMPFSKGPRACLGKNLALMELKLITATLIGRYSVSLSATCTEESMEMTDHFLVLPKGGKCELILSRVDVE